MAPTSLLEFELDAAHSGCPMEGLGRLGAPLTLRSQDPEGVTQEAKAQPTDQSCIRALHCIQLELTLAALLPAPGNILGKLRRIRENLKGALQQERRGRPCPRFVYKGLK